MFESFNTQGKIQFSQTLGLNTLTCVSISIERDCHHVLYLRAGTHPLWLIINVTNVIMELSVSHLPPPKLLSQSHSKYSLCERKVL